MRSGALSPSTHSEIRLAGWQVAFMAVRLPGLLLAILVILTIREPPRLLTTAQSIVPASGPFVQVIEELGAMRRLGRGCALEPRTRREGNKHAMPFGLSPVSYLSLLPPD
jgi:hypothetical protein